MVSFLISHFLKIRVVIKRLRVAHEIAAVIIHVFFIFIYDAVRSALRAFLQGLRLTVKPSGKISVFERRLFDHAMINQPAPGHGEIGVPCGVSIRILRLELINARRVFHDCAAFQFQQLFSFLSVELRQRHLRSGVNKVVHLLWIPLVAVFRADHAPLRGQERRRKKRRSCQNKNSRQPF